MRDLAIVIPAYKEAYFRKALQSLAQQTNKNFTLYIGDDFSSFDLKKIADEFSDTLDIVYKRFPFNIGSKNLVNQWTRCIELTRDENWLWLFSDDDLADPNCVESFYKCLQINGDRFDVYRFKTSLIDNAGVITREPLASPDEESSEEMAYNLLLGKRGNSMPDHIFSRKVYQSNDGFVFTDYAQSADWATSISFSKEKGLCVIQDARIYWRQSGQNISSVPQRNRMEMIGGYLSFLIWVQKHFEYLDDKSGSKITRRMIKHASWMNFKNLMEHHYKGFDLKDFRTLTNFLHKHFNLPHLRALWELCIIEVFVLKQQLRVWLSSVKRSVHPGKKNLISA